MVDLSPETWERVRQVEAEEDRRIDESNKKKFEGVDNMISFNVAYSLGIYDIQVGKEFEFNGKKAIVVKTLPGDFCFGVKWLGV